MTSIARALTDEEVATAKAGLLYLKMTVEFGPALIRGMALTKSELADLLDAEARKHPKAFSSQLIAHISEHIRMSIKVHGTHSEPAKLTFMSGYSGCGSCDPGDGNNGQVCYDDEGGSSCEVCA